MYIVHIKYNGYFHICYRRLEKGNGEGEHGEGEQINYQRPLIKGIEIERKVVSHDIGANQKQGSK